MTIPHSRLSLPGFVVPALLMLLAPAIPAHADDQPTLDPLLVEQVMPSLTQSSPEDSAERLARQPGGGNLVDMRPGERRLSTLDDALSFQPGVVVQEFFGGNDQPRLNIRGSGIQSNPQARGVRLLRDGLPLNQADGSYVIGMLEPRTANHMEVYRGANAVRHGATALGGAVNLVSPTGRNRQGTMIDLGAGSFGQRIGQISRGIATGDADLFVTGIYSTQDGFRDNNSSRRGVLGANAGLRHSDSAESRIYLDYTDLRFEIPGPLNRAQLRDDPTQVNAGISPPPPGPETGTISVGPNVVRDKPERNAEFLRLAGRTTLLTRAGEFAAGVAYLRGDDSFLSPTSDRQSDSDDVSVSLSLLTDPVSLPGELEVGIHGVFGETRRDYFANEDGSRGRRFASNRLTAADAVLYAEYRLPVTPRLTGIAALQGVYALRDIDERFSDPSGRPRYNAATGQYETFATDAAEQRRSYTGVNGRLGLLYQFTPHIQGFANVSQSYEPPTFLELLSPTGATPDLGPNDIGTAPLDAQRAITVELGTRGNHARLDWDLAVYFSRLRDELLTTEAFFGGVGVTSNYSDTTSRRGVELGLGLDALENLFVPGDLVRLRTVYEYSDFRFDGGPFDGNRIAGVPRHRLQAELLYRHPAGVYGGPNLLWLPQDTPTDHANTIDQHGYSLLGARLGYRPRSERWSTYLEGRNLTDRTFASSYLIREQVENPAPPNAGPDQVATFIPGTGRQVFAGLTMHW